MRRVKLTNKKTGLVIEGEGASTKFSDSVRVIIDGSTTVNYLRNIEWDIEWQVELPTRLGAVILADYAGTEEICCQVEDGMWLSKSFEIYASDNDSNFVVKKVLFEGVDK